MKSLNIAATGMQAQQTNVEVISNNLANMTTTGFKRYRPEFQDLIYQDLRRMGTNSSDIGTIVPTGVQVGLGVRTAGVYRAHEQGTVQLTDNPLDLAINGRGFFQVELPNGEFAYTRNGSFQLSPNGEIVTVDGYLVTPNITVPQEAVEIAINANGEVEAVIDGQLQPDNLGQLEMATFINPNGLRAMGNNLFLATQASGDPLLDVPGAEGFGEVLQGFLEQSNVDPVTEITNLVVAQRAYEMNSNVITSTDEMWQSLNQSA